MSAELAIGTRVRRLDPSSLGHRCEGTVIERRTEVVLGGSVVTRLRVQWDAYCDEPSKATWVARSAESKRWEVVS